MAELSFKELMDLADSNSLRAQRYFEEQYSWRRFLLKDLYSIASKMEYDGDTFVISGLKMSLQLLRKFGCKIKIMTIDLSETIEDFCHNLETSISKYCASSLFHLKLIHVSKQSNLMQTVFANLQTLEFQYCTIIDQTFNFNAGFPNLHRLIFTGWNNINQDSLNIQFAALRELATTMYIQPHLQHFNIAMATFVNIRALNPNLSTSITTASEL